MAPHQERVVTEKAELDDKRVRLSEFIGTETFKSLHTAEQHRLILQLYIMGQYSSVLFQRIAAF